LNSAYSTT